MYIHEEISEVPCSCLDPCPFESVAAEKTPSLFEIREDERLAKAE